MNILIIGKSGMGKSLLGDKIKNYIFKTDKDSKIIIDDSDIETKEIGHGNNIYNIYVRQIAEQEVIEKADVVIEVETKELANRIKEI